MKHGLLLAIALFSFACLKPAIAQEQASSKEELEEVKGALQGVSESAAEYRGLCRCASENQDLGLHTAAVALY